MVTTRLVIGDRRAVGCPAVWSIISRGWGSNVWTEALLTYMAPVVLVAEFALTAVPGDDG